MTISALYAADTYAGNGSTDTFAITFPFLSDSTFIKVSVKVDATGVITEKTVITHYNVSGTDVVFTAGNVPASGETIIIEFESDYFQSSDYRENSSFSAEGFEDDLDKLALEVQVAKDDTARALKFDPTVTITDALGTIPDPDGNGDFVLKLNGTEDGWEFQSVAAVSGIANVVEDTSPQLGGILDTNTFDIWFDDNTGIDDSTGAAHIIFQETASAVNYLELTNAATGNGPSIVANGTDSNIDLVLDSKGTGDVDIQANVNIDRILTIDGDSSDAGEIRLAEDTDNGTNYMAFKSPAAITANTTLVLPDGDGTAEYALTTDGAGTLSWAQPGTLKLLSSATASTDASLDFNDVFSATYDHYLITFSHLLPDTDDSALRARLSSDSGATYRSGAVYYRASRSIWSGATTEFNEVGSGITYMSITSQSGGEGLGNVLSTDGGFNGYVHVYKPFTSAAQTQVSVDASYGNNAGDLFYINGAHKADAAEDDSIQFYMSTGNLASGTIRIYGVNQ